MLPENLHRVAEPVNYAFYLDLRQKAEKRRNLLKNGVAIPKVIENGTVDKIFLVEIIKYGQHYWAFFLENVRLC